MGNKDILWAYSFVIISSSWCFIMFRFNNWFHRVRVGGKDVYEVVNLCCAYVVMIVACPAKCKGLLLHLWVFRSFSVGGLCIFVLVEYIWFYETMLFINRDPENEFVVSWRDDIWVEAIYVQFVEKMLRLFWVRGVVFYNFLFLFFSFFRIRSSLL